MIQHNFNFALKKGALRSAQIESAIKRINQRTLDIARKYGTSSYQYKSSQAAMKLLPSNMLRTTKDGITQISRSKKTIETISANSFGEMRSIGIASKKMTAGEYDKNLRERFIDEYGHKPTPTEFKEFAQMDEELRSFTEEGGFGYSEFVNDDDENIEEMENTGLLTTQAATKLSEVKNIMHKSHKTYEELRYAKDIITQYKNDWQKAQDTLGPFQKANAMFGSYEELPF